MINIQSNTQSGRRVAATGNNNFAGLEGLLVKLTNNSGVLNAALPSALNDYANCVIHDGGYSASTSVSGNQAAIWPLSSDRNFRLWLNGSCNPGDILVLANPGGTRSAVATPNGGSFTSLAGMVSVLPALGTGLTLGSVTLSSGKITAVAVSAGGTGYTNGQQITFTDATGYGASGHLVVTSGVVGSVVIDDGGAGYTAPTPVVQPPGVQYRRIGVAEEAGQDGTLVLVRPDLGFVTV